MDKKDWLTTGFYLVLVLILSALMSCFPSYPLIQLFIALIGAITGNIIYKKIIKPMILIQTGNTALTASAKENLTKNEQFFLSSVCASIVLPMGIIFQKMAYWSHGLFWFWLGVACAYLIWLLGIFLLIHGFMIKNDRYSLWTLFLILLTIVLLIVGFLWITFIVCMWMG